jgi:hypothetical protein
MKTIILILLLSVIGMTDSAQDPATTSPQYYKVLLENCEAVSAQSAECEADFLCYGLK